MSTPPLDPGDLKRLEVAQAFFAELGVPFAWHVTDDGEFHSWAIVDDPVDAGGRRGAPARRRPAQRRRHR